MKAIGLMAGTSLDGIDAALVELKRSRGSVKAELLAFRTYAYSGETVRLILEASDPKSASLDQAVRLNFFLGELFAEAALKIMKKAGIRAGDVEFIGSHGQTVLHLPEPVKMGNYKVRATCQIGEPSVIAARTGILTVADFRPADIAAGGGGAPLAPYVDYLLFRALNKTRLLVNIGGIANVTVLPKGSDDPLDAQASDIGPGNMVIDELVSRMTGRNESYDRDGRHAARGKVNHKLLSDLLAGGFFQDKPPKSTGRERFGAAYVDRILKAHPARGRKNYLDLIATATALTAQAIHQHYQRFYARKTPVDEVIVSGGGARNHTLMRMLAELFEPAPVASSTEYGIPAEAKEAIAFAILAMETIDGRPGNLPGATGAKKRAVLGKIVPAG
jgi:anhydro-N-acetylmuramic acid kinase